MKFSTKKTTKALVAKLISLSKISFVLPIIFVLTLVFDKAVLYENIAFSIVVPSSEKGTPVFSKKA